MNYSKEEIDEIKAVYPVGTRIHLHYMEGEPQMTRGMRATVQMVDDAGQLHVSWDNGSTLALNLDCDIFRKLSETELALEQQNPELDGQKFI